MCIFPSYKVKKGVKENIVFTMWSKCKEEIYID